MLAAFCPLTAPCAPKLSCPQVVRCASVVGAFPLAQAQRGPVGAALLFHMLFPATKRNRHEKPHATACQLHQINRLTPAHPTKVICHFFRKGKLGLKIAIKLPFFVAVGGNFETDGISGVNRRSRPVRQADIPASAPWLSSAAPGSGETFRHQNIAQASTISHQHAKFATITVGISPRPCF